MGNRYLNYCDQLSLMYQTMIRNICFTGFPYLSIIQEENIPVSNFQLRKFCKFYIIQLESPWMDSPINGNIVWLNKRKLAASTATFRAPVQKKFGYGILTYHSIEPRCTSAGYVPSKSRPDLYPNSYLSYQIGLVHAHYCQLSLSTRALIEGHFWSRCNVCDNFLAINAQRYLRHRWGKS